ncbi:XRE family transcriptional regulator [Sphingorhabdus sp.]|uniref:helix-turn-helix domain-containing protein n=1 Tax=Sphingorhabdus sp. TaxID=1902408 RepID=UPI003340EDB6
MFNIERLELARKRRRFTARILAERAGIAPVTLSRIVNRQQVPDESTIEALVSALGYTRAFFDQDDFDPIDPRAASFRSLTGMTARERDAALAAGSLAFEVMDWVSERFTLPETDILDLGHERNPVAAARMLRQHWAIGEKPIGNMIKLLESKGARVFSLAEDTKNVDAFSCWRNNEPYIFLNTYKSSERSRFDAAHELAHLVLHRHGGPQGRKAETEANNFASAFLMPQADLMSVIPYVSSVDQIIQAKKRWGVAAVALAYRLNKLGLMTEWQYIQINRQYRTSEPQGIPPERSTVWQMILTDLWKDGQSRSHIAQQLLLPDEELENLLFGLVGDTTQPERQTPTLRAV